jgi:hypothetical protein
VTRTASEHLPVLTLLGHDAALIGERQVLRDHAAVGLRPARPLAPDRRFHVERIPGE